MGAAAPTDIFIPILICTFISTLAGVVTTSLYQRINLLQPTLLLFLGGLSAIVAGIVWGFSRLDGPMMELVGTTSANVILLAIIVTFLVVAALRRVNVYDAFVEGAKDGFQTAVRIIPVAGRKVGDFVEFGGLLGGAPVMKVSPFSCERFVARRGRIPAPIHSFRN